MPAVDGIISGFDTTALINAITDIAALPMRGMQERQGEYEETLDAISGLSDRLTSLSEAAEALSEPRGLSSLSSSSSDELVRVSHDDSVVEAGHYTVTVNKLASAETSTSAGYADAGLGRLTHGTLTVNYQGTDHDITIDATNDGLAAVASAINDIDGLSAVVVDTGAATDPYQLIVTGETGLENAVGLDTSGLASGAGQLAFSETVSADDTEVVMNGITLYSDDNTITSIPGLTLEIDAVPTTDTIVKVDRDFDAMVDKVQTFIDAYNEVESFYSKQSVYNVEIGLKGGLAGESGARRVMEDLSGRITNQFDVADNVFSGLSELGVSTQKGGQLELDVDSLRETLVEDYDQVEAFLSSDDGPLKTLQARIEDVYVAPEEGTLASRTESVEGSIRDLEDSISRQQAYIESYTGRLRDKFNSMEAVMGAMQNTAAFLGAMLTSDDS